MAAAGVALIAVQLARSPSKHHWFAQPVGMVGIGLVVLGALVFLMGFLMRDSKQNEPSAPADDLGDRPRIGIRLRGQSTFAGEDTDIRNQDVSVDLDGEGKFEGKRTNIQ